MKTLEKPNGIWGTILLPINNNQIDWVAFEEQIHILWQFRVFILMVPPQNVIIKQNKNLIIIEIVSTIALKKEKFQRFSHTNPRICQERAKRMVSLNLMVSNYFTRLVASDF